MDTEAKGKGCGVHPCHPEVKSFARHRQVPNRGNTQIWSEAHICHDELNSVAAYMCVATVGARLCLSKAGVYTLAMLLSVAN